MKKVGLGLFTFLGFALVTRAQVSVEIVQDQDQFLIGETVPTAVRITNRSGQPIHFGADNDWLSFSVASREGRLVTRDGVVPVIGEFDLGSSKRATKRVDLGPYFNLSLPGRYEVVATVKIKSWGREVSSQPMVFTVIEGAKLWEQEFGLPTPASARDSAPEVRKYVLQEANHLKSQLRLYLRITDATGGKTFRVFPIGAMVSFSRPEPQLDRFNNLHLLYQSGPRFYSYHVFSPDGDVITQQIYDYVDARPRLRVDPEGNVLVKGGVRRLSPDERPESTPAKSPSAEPLPGKSASPEKASS
jgi:hypothetical protein